MKEMINANKLSEIEIENDDQKHQLKLEMRDMESNLEMKDDEIQLLKDQVKKLEAAIKEKEADVIKVAKNQRYYKEKIKEMDEGHHAYQEKISEYQEVVKMLRKQLKGLNKEANTNRKLLRQRETQLEKAKFKIGSIEE